MLDRVNLIFFEQVWEDHLYWPKTGRKLVKQMNRWVKEICRMPHSGIG